MSYNEDDDDRDAALHQAALARARAKQAARASGSVHEDMPEIAFTSLHIAPPAFPLAHTAVHTKLVYVMDGADAARARANYERFIGTSGRGGTYGRGGNRARRLAASFTHSPSTIAGLLAIALRRLEFLAAHPHRTDLLLKFETEVATQIKPTLDAAGPQFKEQVDRAWTLIEQIRKPLYPV